MQVRTWRKGFFTSVMLLIALIAAALLVRVSGDNGGDAGSNSPTSTATTTTTKPDNPTSLEPELNDVLTIRTTTVDCVKIVQEARAKAKVKIVPGGSNIYSIQDDSLMPVGDGARLWADAISTPMKAKDSKEALVEAILAICQGPLYGSTWMHLFAHLEVDGVNIGDLNPWLKPAKVDASEINNLAMSFTKRYVDQVWNTYVVSSDYILKAEYTAELLTRFRLVGFNAEKSVKNYHLAGGGLVVGSFPEVEVNSKQENLPALVLELNSKTGQCLSRIGLNMGDKRPEIFRCSPPPTKKKPRVVKVPPTTVPTVVTTTTTTTTVPPTTVPVAPTTTIGRKGTPATTTPPPPITATTLACAYGFTRNPTTGQCDKNAQSGGDSGSGATPPATTVAPTPTVAPPGSIPTTSQPPAPGTTIVGP